jgi:hypothetical protein
MDNAFADCRMRGPWLQTLTQVDMVRSPMRRTAPHFVIVSTQMGAYGGDGAQTVGVFP